MNLIQKGTNDELILGCCLYYCRDNARDFMPNKNSKKKLFSSFFKDLRSLYNLNWF